MNMLISLGTTIAYLASAVQLGLTAIDSFQMGITNSLFTYFDSMVFLTMFLLIERFIEAYSKSKTGDAVTLLGNLRPTQAILMHESSDEKASGNIRSSKEYSKRVHIDLLKVDDRVNMLHGDFSSSGGYVIRGESKLDESSLTDESRLVFKFVGDEVFFGNVNKASFILIRVFKILESFMLNQIVQVVREDQARRASIERVADLLTGYFVSIVVFFAVSTWIIWMALGLSESLPAGYLNMTVGGWPFWSLQFESQSSSLLAHVASV